MGLAVGITVVVALSWVAAGGAGGEPPEAPEVQLAVRLERESTLDQTAAVIARLEDAAMAIPGVDRVTSSIQESSASLTVALADRDARPAGTDAAAVRARLDRLVRTQLDGVSLQRPGEGGGPGGGGGGEHGAPSRCSARRPWRFGSRIPTGSVCGSSPAACVSV